MSKANSNPQLFIGIMSGTSLDGVDAALVAFENETCVLQNTHFLPYPEELKLALLALHKPQNNELEAACILGCRLAHLYAETTKALLKKAKVKADEIQRHWLPRPDYSTQTRTWIYPTNWQQCFAGRADRILPLWAIFAVATSPLAAKVRRWYPRFIKLYSASKKLNRAIVNIGGIANITYLAKNGEVLGFDSGPGNMLIDSWTKLKTGKDYDANGAWAASGVVIDSLLTNMLAEPYFALPPPKSTGRDLFNDDWLKQHQLYPHLRPQDVARTLTALTAQSICDALNKCGDVDEVYLCGGGAHNQLLFDDLQANIHAASGAAILSTTKALGIDVDWVEAVAFAWLAKQTFENKPSNLPAVTGAKGLRVLGAILIQPKCLFTRLCTNSRTHFEQ